MLTTHKAIETRFAGCRFRSRLEARWAVFFDACGIKWEYEREGYDLRDFGDMIGSLDVGYYLPDFWLPKSKTWVEIKGALPAEHFINLAEEARVFALVSHTRAKEGYIFWGMPDSPIPTTTVRWLSRNHVYPELGRSDEGVTVFPKLTMEAIYAAKSARFEFGESGAR